jgi:SAM-dependent methyltransferase
MINSTELLVTPATDPAITRTIARRAATSREDYTPYAAFNWETALAGFDLNFAYPDYYLHGYHGVELSKNGYLSPAGALSWDPVIRETFAYLQVPGFTQEAVTDKIIKETVNGLSRTPRRILDLGTGTGHAAFAFANYYAGAQVTGVDVAPHMLAVANFKAQQRALSGRVQFRQASAHASGAKPSEYDLITAWALFHEVPTDWTRRILREAYRVCAYGGTFVIYDAFEKKTVRIIPFPEPYLREFQHLDFKAELSAAGFTQVELHSLPEGNWYATARKL